MLNALKDLRITASGTTNKSVCTGIYPLKFVTIRGILEVLVFPSVAKNTAQSKSPTLTLDVLLGVSLCIPDGLETCYLVTVEV